jgi:hypothetical protein
MERKVHIVGSMPLADADAVFTRLSGTLGSAIRRMPDGETGERLGWIGWQHRKLAGNRWLRPVKSDVAYYEEDRRALFEITPETPAGDIVLSDLGYASAARDSYRRFAALKRAGRLDPALRFQVSLPTPLAIVASFIAPASQNAVEKALEARMLAELAEIVALVPPHELAIQWDVAVEFAVLELGAPVAFDDPPTGILARLRRLGNAVPGGVELGFHLCYGDLNHHHFKEPASLALLVRIANGIASGLARPLNFLHMPVPRNRDDDAYFAPLSELALPGETELFLGLIHLSDGLDGARRRMRAANRYCPSYGIATECGFGRRPPETIDALLELHRSILTA